MSFSVSNVASGDQFVIGSGANLLSLSLTTSTTVSNATTIAGFTLAGTMTYTVTYNNATATTTVVFTGNNAADYATIFNAITFQSTSDNPTAINLTRSITLNHTTNPAGNSFNSIISTVTITAVNDVPLNTVSGAQTVNEDTNLTFSSVNSNLISVSDVDNTSLTVTLTGSNGVLTLSGTTGLTFTTGDGTADGTMVFSGTTTNINSALAGMTFLGTSNFNGSGSVQVQTSDGTLTDNDTVNITITAVNDAPLNTVSSAQTVNEDTNLTFSSVNSNLISVSDVDNTSLTVTLTGSNGVLTLSGTTGLTFTTGDGTADGTMVFSGTTTNINSALAGMTFLGTSNFNGSGSVRVQISDGTLTDDDTVNITITAVNDVPLNTVPGAQTVNEDTNLTFSSGNSNLISVSDVDSNHPESALQQVRNIRKTRRKMGLHRSLVPSLRL